ncbi:MAG: hypothetical protein C0399_03500 [Syntrophus sp. (in: bacteria)]|nr:hypothetical protein [Syntrophus sp. (in: bacteria)]
MKNVEIDDLTYQRLSVFAEMEKIDTQEAIKMLVDLQQIPAVKPGPGYCEWLLNLLKVGNEQGEAAAMQYLKDHPYEADNA